MHILSLKKGVGNFWLGVQFPLKVNGYKYIYFEQKLCFGYHVNRTYARTELYWYMLKC